MKSDKIDEMYAVFNKAKDLERSISNLDEILIKGKTVSSITFFFSKEDFLIRYKETPEKEEQRVCCSSLLNACQEDIRNAILSIVVREKNKLSSKLDNLHFSTKE